MTGFSVLIEKITQLFNWLVIVAPWEQALIIRCGKRVRKVDEGIYIKIPFIDRVYRQPIRRRISIIRPQIVTTRDDHAVTLVAALGYRIEDIEKLFDSIDEPEDTIEAECAAAIARYITKHDYIDCRELGRIESSVLEEINLKDYGLGGSEFYITSFAKVKTYRMITGDLAAWSHGNLRLDEVNEKR